MGKTEANQISKQLKSYQERVTKTPEAALQALQRAGLMTKAGQPTKAYRSSVVAKSKD